MKAPDLHLVRKNSLLPQRATTDTGEFDSKVGEQNLLRAFPLFLWRRYFGRLKLPLAEVRNSVDYNPRYTTTKVYELQRDEYTKNSTGETLTS